MNETLRLMQAHRSHRCFTSDPIEPAHLQAILEAAHHGPTSINSHQVTLILIREADTRAQLAAIAGDQPWIAQAPVFITLVLDFYKTGLGVAKTGQTQQIQRSLEGLLSATLDAGIALGNLMTAARSLGLGVVPIGGIRRDPEAVIELLSLPEWTFPVAGLCLGHIAKQGPQKPRMPLSGYCFEERYRAEWLPEIIEGYDESLCEFWRRVGRADGLSWSQNTALFYSQCYFPQVKAMAKAQGLTAEE